MPKHGAFFNPGSHVQTDLVAIKSALCAHSMNKALLCIAIGAAFSSVLAHQATPAWPATLLDKPFHVGDETNKEMRNPRPDGSLFTARFELPSTISPGVSSFVFATIRVGGLLRPNNKKYADAFKRGQMLSRLYINGTEVAVLNKLMRGPDTVANVQKLQIRVPGTALRAGTNELEIRPGADTNNLDDFELHAVVVGARPQ